MAATYTVEQLLALDKAALVEFVKANHDGDKAVDITSISDWREAPEQRQTELLQKFMEAYPIAKGPQLSDSFDDLLSKLARIDSTRNVSRSSPSASSEATQATLPPDPEVEKQAQIRYYHDLVAHGGRPPCPLESLEQVFQSPTDFADLLEPWMDSASPLAGEDGGCLFSNPWARWHEFRRWQIDNRESSAGKEEERYAAWREEQIFAFSSPGSEDPLEMSDLETTLREMWKDELIARRVDWAREVKPGTLADYQEAAQRRLAKHGFHETFQLLRDPRQQDERTTWIEYLEFECWWLDVRSNTVRRQRRLRDAAWKKLVKSGVLTAGETEEAVLAAPLFGPLGHQLTKREKAFLEFIQRTRPYRDAQIRESRQSRLAQWARSQVPEKTAAPAPRRAAKSGKRKRREDEENPEEVVAQRPVSKNRKTEPQRKEDNVSAGKGKGKATRQRNTNQTAGLLTLPVASWELKEGKRRSVRVRDAQNRKNGIVKTPSTLREVT